jgi:hypothetical protein
MGVDGESCPNDGGDLERRESIVEDAVRSAVTQSAEVLALVDRPDLRAFEGMAAILRF